MDCSKVLRLSRAPRVISRSIEVSRTHRAIPDRESKWHNDPSRRDFERDPAAPRESPRSGAGSALELDFRDRRCREPEAALSSPSVDLEFRHCFGQGDRRGPFSWWSDLPLYLRILIGLALGVVAGLWFRPRLSLARSAGEARAARARRARVRRSSWSRVSARHHDLRRVHGKLAARMGRLLVLNTLVAIVIGLRDGERDPPRADTRTRASGRGAQDPGRCRERSSSTTSLRACSRPFVENQGDRRRSDRGGVQRRGAFSSILREAKDGGELEHARLQ